MGSEHGAIRNEINVTPFLDILLVLLVIFLASLQKRKTLDAVLPTPAASECTSDCEAIVLEVFPGREVALNRTRFPVSELRSRIHAAFDGRPTSVLFVKGEKGTTYQDVITAMDVSRGAGVKVLAISPKTVP